MDSLFRFPLDELPFVILAAVIAFTFHEFAHALAADRFGDPTPRAMGRLTLNPRVHLDIFGTLLILIAGIGWAKPVITQPGFFKKRRLMSIVVSLVGPLANLLLAFIGVFLVYALVESGLLSHMSIGVKDAFKLFLFHLISLNMMLFVFNLLPLPPLDGYRIVYEFVPSGARVWMHKVEQWALFIFLLLLFIPQLFHATIGSAFGVIPQIVSLFSSFFSMIFGNHGQMHFLY